MTCHDDSRLLANGIGLTNLIAKPTASIQDLVIQDFLQGREVLLEKVKKYQPMIVAILGISVARSVLSSTPVGTNPGKRLGNISIQTGLQSMLFAGARVFVLPNPSGRNAHYSYQVMKDLFCELKDLSAQMQHLRIE